MLHYHMFVLISHFLSLAFLYCLSLLIKYKTFMPFTPSLLLLTCVVSQSSLAVELFALNSLSSFGPSEFVWTVNPERAPGPSGKT
jgi:hypothetical protein